MKKTKPVVLLAALTAAAALFAPRLARAGLTRAYTDEVQNVAAVPALGIVQSELLSVSIGRIGAQGTRPLRLYATGTDTLLHIGTTLVSVGDTTGAVMPPEGGSINTAFADTTIDFQAGVVSPSGNVKTDGSTFALPTITTGYYTVMVLGWRSDGTVDTHFSPATSTLTGQQDIGLTFQSLAGEQKLGYILLQATAAGKYKTAGSATSIIQPAVAGAPTIVRLNGAESSSPLTTAGDLWTYTTQDARLPLGASGTVLHGGTSAPSYSQVVDSDVAAAAALQRSKLAAGTAGYVVVNDPSTGLLSQEQYLSSTQGGTGTTSTATYPSSGTIVTEAGTETLTNKSLSGTANSFSNLGALYTFTGDGSTVAFTLTGQVMTASRLVMAFVNGRLQLEGSGNAYTRTNATPGIITFTAAPDSGSSLQIIVFNQ